MALTKVDPSALISPVTRALDQVPPGWAWTLSAWFKVVSCGHLSTQQWTLFELGDQRGGGGGVSSKPEIQPDDVEVRWVARWEGAKHYSSVPLVSRGYKKTRKGRSEQSQTGGPRATMMNEADVRGQPC
jgi:hypothetical protein